MLPAPVFHPVHDRVRALIADQLNLEVGRVTEATDLRIDLGADSLDMIEIGMAVEEEFGIAVTDKDVDAWSSVADVARTVERLFGARQS
jgi:acyl carrier protein